MEKTGCHCPIQAYGVLPYPNHLQTLLAKAHGDTSHWKNATDNKDCQHMSEQILSSPLHKKVKTVSERRKVFIPVDAMFKLHDRIYEVMEVCSSRAWCIGPNPHKGLLGSYYNSESNCTILQVRSNNDINVISITRYHSLYVPPCHLVDHLHQQESSSHCC